MNFSFIKVASQHISCVQLRQAVGDQTDLVEVHIGGFLREAVSGTEYLVETLVRKY